jgi:hypothetical protein
MEKFQYRAYIRTRALLRVSPTEITKELFLAHGDQTPTYITVCKWTVLVNDGRENLADDSRSERPITVSTEVNIELIRQLIEENRHSNY